MRWSLRASFNRDQAAAFTLFIIVAASLLMWATRAQFNLSAFGCDPFGYARQAELFREHGLLKGFDTRIDTVETRELIQVAKSVTDNPFFWAHGVAPHCHHYEESSQRVILQYPPGTGLLLSAFPEPVAMAYWVIIGCTLATVVFVILTVRFRPTPASMLSALLALGLVCWLITQPGATASPSIPFSIFLCPVIALLAFIAFPTDGRSSRKVAALVFGLLCGLLLAVRYANLFLLVGLAVQIGLSTRIWVGGQARRHFAAIGWAAAGFALTGPAIILYATYVNTGSVFVTTYGGGDTNPPVISVSLILQNLRFYLGNWYGTPPVVIAFGFLAWRAFSKPDGRGLCVPGLATAGALVSLLVSIAYFLTHDIAIEYYLIPASVLAVCLIAIDSQINSPSRGEEKGAIRGWKSVVLASMLFVLARGALVEPYRPVVKLPEEVFGERTIVWADHSSGTSTYYLGKVAAVIAFIDPGLREDMVRALAHRGWTQYFVLDSKNMHRARNLLTNSMELSDAGSAVNFGEFPIWKLAPGGVDVRQERMKISSAAKRKYTPEELGRLKFVLRGIGRQPDRVVVDFEIDNPNDTAISAVSDFPIRISWRFLDAQGEPMSGWDTRKGLSFDVLSHSSLKMNLMIDTKTEVKGGSLQISFVQEGAFWAHDVGFQPLTIPWP